MCEQIHVSSSEPCRDLMWNAFLTLRPDWRDGSDNVVCSNPVTGRKLALSRATVIRLILDLAKNRDCQSTDKPKLQRLQQAGVLSSGSTDDVVEGLPSAIEWVRFGWQASLDYFMWSRHVQYADKDDRTGSIRCSSLQAYVDERGLPPTRMAVVGAELVLPIPEALPKDAMLGNIMMRRRTVRRFRANSASLQDLSNVLWHGLEHVRQCRALSQQNLMNLLVSYGVAFEFFLICYDVQHVPCGVYSYDLFNHRLILIQEGDYRERMIEILVGQSPPSTAHWTVILLADYDQYQWRYRHERALRNIYIEAGRICHELIMYGLAYNVGTFMTPAIRDSRLLALLQINDTVRFDPIYTLTMGLIK